MEDGISKQLHPCYKDMLQEKWLSWKMGFVQQMLRRQYHHEDVFSRQVDLAYGRVVEKIKKIKVKVLRDEKQQVENDLLLKEGKVYMLRNKELRIEIIQLYHNIPIARHRGNRKQQSQ